MWRCQYCETYNNDDAVVCEVCGNSKGTQTKMPASAPAENMQAHVILDQSPAAGYSEAPVHQPAAPQPAPAAEESVYSQPAIEEAAAPKKKRSWMVWLAVILVFICGSGAVSWIMFEEEIRTFIADITGSEDGSGDKGNAADDATAMPEGGEVSGEFPAAAPTENGSVFSMGGGFMNNITEATAEVTAEITPEPSVEPAVMPSLPPDYVPPQSVSAQSPAEDIVYLQNKLREIGLLIEGEFTYGQYDTATATGVINLQRQINAERGYVVLTENGECDALTLSYVELYQNSAHAPVVNYVNYAAEVAVQNEYIGITVSSNAEADTLIMYRDKNAEVMRWSAAENSAVSGAERIWNVGYTFGEPGDLSLSYAVSNDGGTSVSVSVDSFISVAAPVPTVPPTVYSVECGVYEAAHGEPVMVTVRTNVEANGLVLNGSDGSTIGMWNANDSSYVEGDVRIWTIDIGYTAGNGIAMEFAASNDAGVTVGGGYGAPSIALILLDAYYAEPVYSVAYCNEDVPFVVRTDARARFLHMFSEDMTFLQTWNAEEASYVEGTERIWNVAYRFGYSGANNVNFAVSYDNLNHGATCMTGLVIADYAPQIVYAGFDIGSSLACAPVPFTVKTNADAERLIMSAEDGTVMAEWYAEGNSYVNGTERIWNTSCAFANAGYYNVTFTATRADGTAGNAYGASIEIYTIAPNIGSVTMDKPSAVVGENIAFTLVTNINAERLIMYSEDGTPMREWTADTSASVVGVELVWNVNYAFKVGGDRTVSFAVVNAYDGATSNAVPVNISVNTVHVTAVAFINSIAYCDEYVTLTAITDEKANYLHMYMEDMTEVVEWNAIECSSVVGTRRTWNVTYKFAVPGVRNMIFAASYDGENPGEPSEPKQITIVKDQPGVGFIHCDKEEVAVGDVLPITVKTNADANQLIMKSENGDVVAVWDAEFFSILNGTERIWNIEYSFSVGGERTVYFCASRDAGMTTGEDYEMIMIIK